MNSINSYFELSLLSLIVVIVYRQQLYRQMQTQSQFSLWLCMFAYYDYACLYITTTHVYIYLHVNIATWIVILHIIASRNSIYRLSIKLLMFTFQNVYFTISSFVILDSIYCHFPHPRKPNFHHVRYHKVSSIDAKKKKLSEVTIIIEAKIKGSEIQYELHICLNCDYDLASIIFSLYIQQTFYH